MCLSLLTNLFNLLSIKDPLVDIHLFVSHDPQSPDGRRYKNTDTMPQATWCQIPISVQSGQKPAFTIKLTGRKKCFWGPFPPFIHFENGLHYPDWVMSFAYYWGQWSVCWSNNGSQFVKIPEQIRHTCKMEGEKSPPCGTNMKTYRIHWMV